MIQPYTDSTTDSKPNTYYVKVTGSSSDYQLSVLRDPDFEVTGDFVVTGSTPADGELIQDPTTFQVEVSHDVLASSLDASDLKIDGQAATSVRLVDGRTIEFTLPTGITEKTYTATIAAGAITDIDGPAIPATTSTFRPDLVSPHLVGASLTSGDIVESGDLEVELQFNETLLASVLDAGDVQLVGIRTGSYTPDAFSYNAESSKLSLVYDNLPDDSYTLTLVSGAEAFRDTVGHGLDGGDIEIQFGTYVDEVPLSMESIGPAAADASAGSALGMVSANSADTYAVSAVAGNTASVSLEPDSDLRATIELLRPDGSVYASATATSAGEAVSLQNVPVTESGVYSVAVRGVDGSAGEYQIRVLLNAVREDQALDEETVENLDSRFLPLDDQGDQIVVYGSLHAIGESFDSLEVDDSWRMADESIAFVSDEWGSVDGDSALMMHGGRGGAIWTVDVSEIDNPILSFWHASWEGAGQSLNWYESWSSNQDDGIIIDDVDGDAGDRYKWIPPEQQKGEWVYYSFNLADIAEQNGEALASQYEFHFQQVDWFVHPEAVCGYISDRLLPEVGRGWDAILVTSADPIGDWYEFSLEDGETANLAMAAEGMPAESILEIYDDAGNLLATGEVDADGAVTIGGFRNMTTDGAADKYHVRAGAVVTTPEWPYSLVITRDAQAADDSTPFEIVGVTAGAETVGTVPTLDITFSDDLTVNSVDAEDLLVNGAPAESVRVFNSRTIRVQPRVLTSGTWNVQVAAGAVTDIQGTALEALSTNVTVSFADALLSDGLLNKTRFLGELDSPGQTDSWQVQLEAGQRMTALLLMDDDLTGTVSLTGPDGSQVASGTAPVGQFVAIEYTAASAGTYTLSISGADGAQGEYEGTLHLNAIVDPASVVDTADDEDANDSAASAVALDSVFFDIADGGQAATVRGSLACSTTFVTEEDFTPGGGEEPETDFLLNGWWVDANRGELPRPRLGYGDGVLSFPAGYYESASQTEDIAGYYEANWSRGIPYNVETANAITLEFDFRVSDADVRFTSFSGAFTDEANATGIAISNDELTWYPVWNAQLQTVGEWVHYSIDLSAAAEAAGITLSNLTRIRFQYYAPVGTEGTGDESIAFDNLVVSDKVATEEWYQFNLAAGQTVAAVADSDASIQIDVLDARLNVVASGVADAGVQQAIDQVTASVSGTYYLRVTGTDGVYSLAVARDASADWAQSVTVPEYVVDPRLAEHTVFPTTSSDGSSNGYGQAGTSIDFGESASATDLGTVLHQEVADLDLTNGTLSFQLQAAHTAYMTVIGNAADSGTLQLKLTDVQSGETIYSVDVDGVQRLDLSADDDRTYLLEVAGTATNANLRLLNLVDRRDASVTVYGTDDADDVVFDATTSLDVSIQGITYPFRDFDNLVASFEGDAGDKVTLIGSTGDEEVNLTPDSATMTGEGWRVSVYNVTCYEAFGGGGSDTASLYDSTGNDQYESRPGLTTMTGPGFDMTVHDFETCHGYAKAGGVDTAVLYSPGGASKFKSDAEAGYAKLYGPASFTRAKFFEVVEAYNSGDLGVARMFDSSGNDRFSAKDSQRRLITPKYDLIVYGFTNLIVTSRAGGRDTATLSDSVPDGEVLVRGFTGLDAGVEEDAGSDADDQDTSLAPPQQDVVAPNTDTALVGPCSTSQTACNDATSTSGAVLADDDQTFDPLILADAETNDTITTATALPLGFETLESEAIRIESDLSGTDSCDCFRLELDAGDVFSARISGDAERVTLLDGRGVNLIRSAYDAGWNYPAESPLVGDGGASVSWVVATAGVYYVRVSEGTGEYQLDLQVFRPTLESEPVGTCQILFLDFDGASVDTSEFREDGDVRGLSPLAEFLSDLGLEPDQDLDAVIDAIVATVTENLSLSIRESGLNGDFDASGNPGEFDIVILNSRDDGEQYGNANVTRVVIGGTVEEFGINTVGMASSIDVGNFDTEETAVVLLDMLTDPDPASWNTASLNAVAIDPSADMIDLVGRAIGNIASHEAGHLFGNWHTWNDNQRDVLTDTGGNYSATFGLGPDGIFGTDDDVDVDFGYDVYSPSEPYQGMQDSLVTLAYGLSTGTQVSSSTTGRSDDDSAN